MQIDCNVNTENLKGKKTTELDIKFKHKRAKS